MFSSVDFFNGHQNALLVAAIAPLALLIVVLLAPLVLRDTGADRARRACTRSRRRSARRAGPGAGGPDRVPQPAPGRRPRRSPSCRRGRCSACPAGSCSSRSGSTSTAPASAPRPRSCSRSTSPRSCRRRRRTSACSRRPAPPCCTPAGTSAYGDGVAFGVILQAVEVTTAILMGMPALLKEGMSWREVRLRAMHTTPVKLPARPSSRAAGQRRTRHASQPAARPAGLELRPRPSPARPPSTGFRVRVGQLGQPSRVLVGAGDQLVGRLPARSSAGSRTSSRSTRPAGWWATIASVDCSGSTA